MFSSGAPISKDLYLDHVYEKHIFLLSDDREDCEHMSNMNDFNGWLSKAVKRMLDPFMARRWTLCVNLKSIKHESTDFNRNFQTVALNRCAQL